MINLPKNTTVRLHITGQTYMTRKSVQRIRCTVHIGVDRQGRASSAGHTHYKSIAVDFMMILRKFVKQHYLYTPQG